ncbi:MAG TPA: DUF3618 domain-containing protein [Thermoleophilaceae bacterium]|jgi:hypothetical protein
MSGQQQTPEELRREIERTRRELGDTVDALSQKADVKRQVASNSTPIAAAIGGLIALLVLLRILRNR